MCWVEVFVIKISTYSYKASIAIKLYHLKFSYMWPDFWKPTKLYILRNTDFKY